MSIPYEEVGRIRQKLRTRAALVAAVHALLQRGITPTVDDAAQAAAVSRTTAYRYFRNQRELLAAAHPEIEATSLLGVDPPPEPEARLDLVLTEIERQIRQHAPELRAMLRLSLDPEIDRRRLLLRQGRAIRWFQDALTPLRGPLSERSLRRLALALRTTFGIEAFIWLTEVAALSPDDAFALMRWSAKTLFQSALANAAAPRANRSKMLRRRQPRN